MVLSILIQVRVLMIKLFIIIIFCYLVYGFIKNLLSPKNKNNQSDIIDAEYEEIE